MSGRVFFHTRKHVQSLVADYQALDSDSNSVFCLNAAAGLMVTEKFSNFNDAYNNTREHILSGKTSKHLKNIQSVWEYIRKNY